MMRAVSAVFLVLFICISVFPQEVIKEKVEITPSQKNYHKVQGSQSHSLSVNFTWDLPEREANVYIRSCDTNFLIFHQIGIRVEIIQRQ